MPVADRQPSLGGSFLPGADYTITGDWEFRTAPVLRGASPYAVGDPFLTVSGSASGIAAALAIFPGTTAMTTVGPLVLTPTSFVAGSPAGLTTRIGEGRATGNPAGTCTVAANGVGVLTGTYRYAYYELDPTGSGTTGLSPVSAPIVLSANQTLVTVPTIRRGLGGRVLCRTKAGGSVYYILQNLNSQSFYQTIWPDNALDSTLTVLAPTVDTTVLYSLETNAGVKFLRTHPDQGSAPADLTLLTGDATAGTYSLDSYGTIYVRGGPTSRPLQTQMTGTADYQYAALFLPAQNDGGGTTNAGTTVFTIRATGEVAITPPATVPLSANPALSTFATLPTGAGTTDAVTLTATGAGTAATTQRALSVILSAGYTGTGVTYGVRGWNNTISAGGSIGVHGEAIGAAATGVGVQGIASGATQNIAVFAGLGSALTGVGAGLSGAFVGNVGTTGLSILLGIASGSVVFQVQSTGTIVSSGGATWGGATNAGAAITLTGATTNAELRGLTGFLTSATTGLVILANSTRATGVGFDVGTDAILKLRTRAQTGGAVLDLLEQTAPAAGAADTVRIYAQDNGGGKTQLMALFSSGAAQQLAIQP